MKKRIFNFLLLNFFLINLSLVQAQSTDASITGVALDGNGSTLPGVSISVRNESTGFQTVTMTNNEGRYFFKQLPLGKPYTVKASYVGFAVQVKNNLILNLGDQLVINFTLSQSSTDLGEIIVTDKAINSRIDRLGASTSITAENIQQIPAQNRSFTNLSALAPTTNGGNIGGQLFSSTNYLIDGVSARNNLTSGEIGRGPFTLSLEAIREFEVITNVYDVTQGRQGGGAISAVTKSGTNQFTATAFDYFRSDFLASPYDIRGNKRNQQFTTNQYGFSAGGAIIKDKLHFFTALDRQDQAQPLFIADIQNDDDANALRISRGALDSVLSIGRAKYGLSNSQQIGEFGLKTLANTFFARLDWQINLKNRLTIRNNYTVWVNPSSTKDKSPINLF